MRDPGNRGGRRPPPARDPRHDRRPADRPAPRASAAWDFLPPALQAAVARAGFAAPTPVQAAALPRALAGESLAAVAPTGTGKTLAYLLPALGAMARGRRSLVLLPTRELAYQVSQMLRQLDPAASAVLALGGHPLDRQLAALAADWGLLIATPGRLLEILDKRPRLFTRLGLAVLDEFDKLLGMGFGEQVAAILARPPAGVQLLLFSATAPDAGWGAVPGAGALPRLDLAREEPVPLEEAFYFLKSARKKGDLLLGELAGLSGQAMVFVRNREKANHLHGLLKLRGYPSAVLHGHLDQRQRAAAFQAFRDGKAPVLVATDLAARGLDVSGVDLIVNFDLPRDYRDYLHRSGRAARRGRPGRCLSFAGPDEYLRMRNLERDYPPPLPAHPDFSHKDLWYIQAKRVHDAKAKAEARAEAIRNEQESED